MSSFDEQADLRELTVQLGRLRERFADPAESLFEVVPGVSGWSAAAHAHHVVLACYLSLRNASALLEGDDRFAREPVNRPDETQRILRAGAIPRGGAEAPPIVSPPPAPNLEEVQGLLDKATSMHAAVTERLDAAPASSLTIAHHELGDLNAVEWIRFARIHTQHHLEIIDEILAALA